MIGPDGRITGTCEPSSSDFIISNLDRTAPEWETALQKAKPWRRLARQGDIYKAEHVNDPRSLEKVSL